MITVPRFMSNMIIIILPETLYSLFMSQHVSMHPSQDVFTTYLREDTTWCRFTTTSLLASSPIQHSQPVRGQSYLAPLSLKLDFTKAGSTTAPFLISWNIFMQFYLLWPNCIHYLAPSSLVHLQDLFWCYSVMWFLNILTMPIIT